MKIRDSNQPLMTGIRTLLLVLQLSIHAFAAANAESIPILVYGAVGGPGIPNRKSIEKVVNTEPLKTLLFQPALASRKGNAEKFSWKFEVPDDGKAESALIFVSSTPDLNFDEIMKVRPAMELAANLAEFLDACHIAFLLENLRMEQRAGTNNLTILNEVRGIKTKSTMPVIEGLPVKIIHVSDILFIVVGRQSEEGEHSYSPTVIRDDLKRDPKSLNEDFYLKALKQLAEEGNRGRIPPVKIGDFSLIEIQDLGLYINHLMNPVN